MTLTPTTPAGPPAERPLRADAARNRARILCAAEEVFAEHGLSATLDDVARHAGLGTGTVYRRFASREALVEALFEERIERATALAERCLQDDDPWHGLVTLLEGFTAGMASDRGLRQVMTSSTFDQERVACARSRMLAPITELLCRARDAGQLRPEVALADVPVLLHTMGAVCEFSRDASPELWRRYLALLLEGMRARDDAPALPVPPLDEQGLRAAMARTHRDRRRPPV